MIHYISTISEDKKSTHSLFYNTKFIEDCNPENLLIIISKPIYFNIYNKKIKLDLILCKEGVEILKICFSKYIYYQLLKLFETQDLKNKFLTIVNNAIVTELRKNLEFNISNNNIYKTNSNLFITKEFSNYNDSNSS